MDKKTVLIAYASRMGSTAEIASAIGEQLSNRGFQVDVRPAHSARDARLYDAVIVGSAVYLGHWEKDAVAYLKHQAPDLAERPSWLFQSGPVGPQTDQAHQHLPHSITKLCLEIGLDHPVTFGGILDPARAKGHLARWVASSSELTGDFRDWHQVSAWAESIADQLARTPAVTAV